MRQLLARKDVRLLFAGQTLSMFGDWMIVIVIGIWMKVLTGSNGAAGLVFFVLALAGLATAYQVRSPSHVQGRVSAAANMLFSVPQTISIAAGTAEVEVEPALA